MFKKKEVEIRPWEKLQERINKRQDLNFFNVGFLHQRQTWNLIAPQSLLFVGALKSGKSASLVRVVSSFYLQNSENSLVFLMDWNKGANDYQMMFDQENVYSAFSGEKILEVIDLAYAEMKSREANENVYNLSHMLLVMEDLKMMLDALFDYELNKDTENTSAWKLKKIITEGSRWKIYILGTMYEAPSLNVLELFTTKVTFKCDLQTSFKMIGSEDAYKIEYSLDNRLEFSAFCNQEKLSSHFIGMEEWRKIIYEK